MTEQPLPLAVKPIITYPREAQVGKTYLMTIDLQPEEGFEWQYEEEEYPIYCLVDSELFNSKPVGEPVIVLHRFGGTYGEARFLLTATQQAIEGKIRVILVNKWGAPIKVFPLYSIKVKQNLSNGLESVIKYKERTSQTSNVTFTHPRNALIVGINTYSSGHLRNLRNPSKDAEAIAQRLEQDGEFQVKRLPEIVVEGKLRVGKQTQVTLRDLQQALVKLFKPDGRQVPDTALFYFSGHGIRVELGVQEGYLATSDINPGFNFFGLSLRWLRQLLEESPIRQQIVWLDCCHSGELLNIAEADPGDRGKGRDRCFIAASRDFETAWQDIGSSYSVLTKELLEGLDPSRCPDSWVDNYNLVDFLYQRLQGATQRPIFTNFGEPINLTRIRQPPEANATAASESDIWPYGICPYKGLLYFDCNESDPKYFYGRTALTDQLLDQVRQSNFLAIVGASGSGKSSVLRAGLLYQLKQGRRLLGSDHWQIRIMLPGEHPLQSLALAFVDADLSLLDRVEQLGKAEGLLKVGADGLRRLVQVSNASRLVLVVDQFEEVFTLCYNRTERQQFFECLLGAVDQLGNKLCLVLALRTDFLSICIEQDYAGLASKIRKSLVIVPPMNREELRQAITEPARQVNLQIEPELVNQMILDVEQSPGSLPLLQYTLTEMWKMRSGNRLTISDYQRLGGISGVLQHRAEQVFDSLSLEEQRTAQRIFLGLIQLAEGTEDTRRRILKQDLITSNQSEMVIDQVVQRLADEQLVVTSVVLERNSSAYIEVIDITHEVLIRHWPRLRQWLEENRSAWRQMRNLEYAAIQWSQTGKHSDDILRGAKLAAAEELFQGFADNIFLSSLAQEFVQVSRIERDRRIRQEAEKKSSLWERIINFWRS